MNKDLVSGIAVFAFAAAGLGGALALSNNADAQATPPHAKVASEKKAALKQALTLDVTTLETQARAAWDARNAAMRALQTAEAAVADATPGTPEYDAATEAWVKAQGVAIAAQSTFEVANRELESGRALKGSAAGAFVEERCANDDGKDADIKRLCDALAAAKAAAEANRPPAPPAP